MKHLDVFFLINCGILFYSIETGYFVFSSLKGRDCFKHNRVYFIQVLLCLADYI